MAGQSGWTRSACADTPSGVGRPGSTRCCRICSPADLAEAGVAERLRLAAVRYLIARGDPARLGA